MSLKRTYLEVKDHAVSGESFKLLYNSELDMLETFPQPKANDLAGYYVSEDYISHTNTKRDFFEQIYHKVRVVSLKRKLRLINGFNSGKSLLDVGCGTGDFLELAQNEDWQITGIEPNKGARDMANEKTNAKVFNTCHLKRLQPNSFDVITLWHVLEHLPNLQEHISLFNRLLKPNGSLVVAMPNYKSYDASYYQTFWAAYDVPRHLWHFSKTSVERLFQSHDIELQKILPLSFDAYYVCLLSEKYKSGVMNPLQAFWIAWRSNLKAKRTKQYSSLIYVLKHKKN